MLGFKTHSGGRYSVGDEDVKKFGFCKYRCFYYNDDSEKLHILLKHVLKIIGFGENLGLM